MAWHGLPCWRLLDTDFLDGHHFFQAWLRWRTDHAAPRTLHYVAFCAQAPDWAKLWCHRAPDPRPDALAQQLRPQWFGFTPGFNRLLLDQGRVVLTLCVGHAPDWLKQQQFHADSILVQHWQADDPAAWSFKTLSQCCRRGTTISFMAPTRPDSLEPHLRPCGMALTQAPDQPHGVDAVFDPPWALNRRAAQPVLAATERHCAIVGAGLAGASTAAALARRGWQVTVLDQAPAPAAGGSGLPVGLMVAHVSRDDCVLSRLSRAGVRLMLQQARELLVSGQDWLDAGVLERQIDGAPQLPDDWSDAGRDWAVPDQCATDPADQSRHAGIGHRQAGWLKPAQLVAAWLRQPGITLHMNSRVHALHWRDGGWELRDAQDRVLTHAPRVILANAGGMAPLLQTLQAQDPHTATGLNRVPATHNMRGLLSWASHRSSPGTAFPVQPVNGAGAIIANIPQADGPAWYMGSSYQPEEENERDDASNHIGNLQHLQQLLPALAAQLAPLFQDGALQAWKGTRCISTDRLPLVGALDSAASLWLCAAMGSRGLSLSMLCAELLASQWAGEPLPIEAWLAKTLGATRAKARA